MIVREIGPGYGSERSCACGAGFVDGFGVRACGHFGALSLTRARAEFRASFLAWMARRSKRCGVSFRDWNAEEVAAYAARARVALRAVAAMPRRRLP